MSEPKPVAWMVERTEKGTGHTERTFWTTQQGAEGHALRHREGWYRANPPIPLYPGPFRVEWAADSGAGTLDATSERWLAVSWIARDGGRLMRRLVSEWEPEK